MPQWMMQTGAAAGKDACVFPDALAHAGAETEARTAYVELLHSDPGLECASVGLEAATATPPSEPSTDCGHADDELDAGRVARAAELYRALPADAECVKAGLGQAREVLRLCAQGYFDQHHGRPDDASSSYESALKKNPNADCAQTGVDETGPNIVTRKVNYATDALPDGLSVAGAALAVGFALLLLGYVRQLRRLVEWPWFMRPRVIFGAFDDGALAEGSKVGQAFSGQLRANLQRLREQAIAGDPASPYDLDFASPREEFADQYSSESDGVQQTLSKIGDATDHGKLLSAVIAATYSALPVRRFKVSGVLNPAFGGAASATLTVENRSRLEAATTLSAPAAKADSDPETYLPLASPAAIWVQYEIAELLSRGRRQPFVAESYACTREALDRHRAHDEAGARAAYEQALSLNPHNWPASINLAVLQARSRKPSQPASSERLEQTLRDFLQVSSADDPYSADPNYYRLLYQISAVRANALYHPLQSGAGNAARWNSDYANAVVWAFFTLHEAEARINLLDGLALRPRTFVRWRQRGLSTKEDRLHTFLSGTVRPCALAIFVALDLRFAEDAAVRVARAKGEINASSRSYRAHYNFACLEAVLITVAGDAATRNAAIECAFDDLERALRLVHDARREQLIDWADGDPTLAVLKSSPRHRFQELLDSYRLTEARGRRSAASAPRTEPAPTSSQ